VQVAVSPCWEKDLPDVISAYLSLRAWTPTPAARGVHLPVSSSTTSAFPSFGPGRRSAKPVQRFQYGALFEATVISLCSGPQVCSPPRSLLPIRCPPYGSRDFSIRASRGLLPSHAPDMLAVRIGQLTAEDFHLIRYAALSAAPRTPTPHPHRGATRSTARHTTTTLPGVGCRRLFGACPSAASAWRSHAPTALTGEQLACTSAPGMRMTPGRCAPRPSSAPAP